MKSTPESGMRRIVIALTLSAVALVAAGGLTDRMWLLGLGVWALIAAFMIEMIYRP
ncbi:hypothetical protein [Streptomyces sp. H27-C3]|uniref:hypothetical protein n=1 Tax=Streptomyces sp. H27-C3 TaxID=3046305 RepID=UPI0024BA7E8F|nr:hypothetical protein [Streptomyces sp. H27-C3]MDJ0463831.1 hypothetical protein [Streptomyces sp. H27-C3]